MVDLNNLESELDENQKEFIFEYSSLQRKHKDDRDLMQVREKRKDTIFDSKLTIKRSFFSHNNIGLSL